MTELEREQIIEEVIKRIGGNKQVTPRALTETHEKWFRDDKGTSYRSKMTKAIGDPSATCSIWELVRRATCVCCGVQYVRQLKNVEKANEIADKICQLIYDLAIEQRGAE